MTATACARPGFSQQKNSNYRTSQLSSIKLIFFSAFNNSFYNGYICVMIFTLQSLKAIAITSQCFKFNFTLIKAVENALHVVI